MAAVQIISKGMKRISFGPGARGAFGRGGIYGEIIGAAMAYEGFLEAFIAIMDL